MKVVHILDLNKGNAWHNFSDLAHDEFESVDNKKTYVECLRNQLLKFHATVDLMNSTVTFKNESDYSWFLLKFS